MTQQDRILEALKQGHTISPFMALNEFGCYRLSDVIWKLRNKGYNIITDSVEVLTAHGDKATVANYWMIR